MKTFRILKDISYYKINDIVTSETMLYPNGILIKSESMFKQLIKNGTIEEIKIK